MSRRSPTWSHAIGVAATVVGCSILSVLAARQADSSTYESPAAQQLGQAVSAGRPRAVDEFWARRIGHVPLIESIDGQDDFRWITFLWRGDATTSEVRVSIGDIPTPDPRKWTFGRLSNTNVWFKTDRVPKDARFTYLLRVNGGPLKLDPLNDRRFGGRSVAELPDAPTQQWIVEHADTAKGQLTRHTLQSRMLAKLSRGRADRFAWFPRTDKTLKTLPARSK